VFGDVSDAVCETVQVRLSKSDLIDNVEKMKMKSRVLAAMVLKILAVYLFFQFLTVLPAGLDLFQMIHPSLDNRGVETSAVRFYALMTGLFLVVAIAYLAISVVVFRGANRLARLFISDPEDTVALDGPVSDGFLTGAFQCLGVYALISWMPDLFQTGIQCAIYGTWTDPQTPFLLRFYDGWSNLISPFLGVVIGMLLIFRPKGLLRLILLSRPMSSAPVTTEADQ